MRTYLALYKGKKIEVQAETSLEAQGKAAALLKARRRFEVSVVLVDVPVDPASL